ncbi:hypothetical protein V493_08341 [Pseudogymnoascus sp. VKM F-4281 (FW-2241)]|nr:hypothetical protein V493_08341 [Pseudogymnoascus sp. VKM F-4281 (FW-2241)]
MRSIFLVLGVAIGLTAAQRSIDDECSNPSAFISCMKPFNEAREKCATDDKVCECEEKLGVQDCGIKYCPEIAFPVSSTLASYCREVPSGCGGGVAFTGSCVLITPSSSSPPPGNLGGGEPSATSAPSDSGTDGEGSTDGEPVTSKGSGDMLFAPAGGLLGSLVAVMAML